MGLTTPLTTVLNEQLFVQPVIKPGLYNRFDNGFDNRLYRANGALDYISPALCIPVTPFPPIGDAACRQRAGGGPSHGHRQHAQKVW